MSRRTHQQTRRRARSTGILLCWIAGLIPLLGVQSSRVYFHCQITGELLPTCCCERADPPLAPSPPPPCCTRDAGQSESPGEGLAGQECDCCDIHYEQGRDGIKAFAGSKALVFEFSTSSAVPVGRLHTSHAITSALREPSWREPPRRPLYMLFESYRS